MAAAEVFVEEHERMEVGEREMRNERRLQCSDKSSDCKHYLSATSQVDGHTVNCWNTQYITSITEHIYIHIHS